jgi:hypothetical protein
MKLVSKLVRKADKIARKLFCRYIVICNYGGKIYCWSYSEAIDWFRFAGEKVVVVDIIRNEVVAGRSTNKG